MGKVVRVEPEGGGGGVIEEDTVNDEVEELGSKVGEEEVKFENEVKLLET